MAKPRPPADPGRPNPREMIDRARAAAGPKVARAVDAATPKVEKAATGAGRLFGTLRDRAKDTAKQFGEGYRGDDDEPGSDAGDSPSARGPRPRPRPGPRRD